MTNPIMDEMTSCRIISAIPELLAQLPAIGAAILGAFGEIPGMVIDVGKNIVEIQ